jgi:hypothetical protein
MVLLNLHQFNQMVKLSLGVILLLQWYLSKNIARLNTDGSLDTSFNVGKDQTLLLYRLLQF